KDVPVIEAGGITDKVPFADDSGLIAGFLQQLWEGGLRTVEAAVGVVVEAVGVRILAGDERGPARAADRIANHAAIEANSVLTDAIDIRRVEQLAGVAVGTDGLVGVIVGEDDDDVGGRG